METKTIQQQIEDNPLIDLKFVFNKLDILDAKILDASVLKDVLSLSSLVNNLKNFATRPTIKNRLDKLENLKLIKIIKRSNPLCFQLNFTELSNKAYKILLIKLKDKFGLI